MLFLLRPPQTWMSYGLPRTDPEELTRQVQEAYSSTRRTPQYVPEAAPPSAVPVAQLKDLAELHRSGALSDEEFAAAKAQLLRTDVVSG
jgi:Short C-terminal domain